MSAVAEAPTELEPGWHESEADRVVRWRFLMLLDLGFTIEQTQILTAVPNLDWHRAEYLIEKGASHEFVVNELT